MAHASCCGVSTFATSAEPCAARSGSACLRH